MYPAVCDSKIVCCSVGSLLKLYSKVKSIDGGLDDLTELSTARRAWSEVIDNVERGQGDGSSLGRLTRNTSNRGPDKTGIPGYPDF